MLKKENLVALGLVFIVVGALVFAFFETSYPINNFIQKASLSNTYNYAHNLPTQTSVSAYFDSGQTFYFNFTKGRFWGVAYDIQNFGMDPPISEADWSIPEYKTVGLDIYTPSGDVFSVEVYVVEGSSPYSALFHNESADFTPISTWNSTIGPFGVAGRINRSGNYTVQATLIDPPVYRDAQDSYNITTDPPELMAIYAVQTGQTKPYYVLCLSAGSVLMLTGVIIEAWAIRPKNRPSRRSRNSHLKKA